MGEMDSQERILTELVKRLHEFAGDNLESVILYGSAARPSASHAAANLNVLCTLRSLSVSELGRLSSTVSWWTKQHGQPAPLFFTAEELRRSADVFAIELLDMQQAHRVLFGLDVVAGIAVPMNLHRVQVEHELRTLQLKLRQHFFRAAGNDSELKAVMAKSVSSTVALLRHALIAFGEEPPAASREVVARLTALTGAEAQVFETWLQIRHEEISIDEVSRFYGRCLDALGKVVAALDERLPKSEWRRVARQNS